MIKDSSVITDRFKFRIEKPFRTQNKHILIRIAIISFVTNGGGDQKEGYVCLLQTGVTSALDSNDAQFFTIVG